MNSNGRIQVFSSWPRQKGWVYNYNRNASESAPIVVHLENGISLSVPQSRMNKDYIGPYNVRSFPSFSDDVNAKEMSFHNRRYEMNNYMSQLPYFQEKAWVNPREEAPFPVHYWVAEKLHNLAWGYSNQRAMHSLQAGGPSIIQRATEALFLLGGVQIPLKEHVVQLVNSMTRYDSDTAWNTPLLEVSEEIQDQAKITRRLIIHHLINVRKLKDFYYPNFYDKTGVLSMQIRRCVAALSFMPRECEVQPVYSWNN